MAADPAELATTALRCVKSALWVHLRRSGGKDVLPFGPTARRLHWPQRAWSTPYQRHRPVADESDRPSTRLRFQRLALTGQPHSGLIVWKAPACHPGRGFLLRVGGRSRW